MADNALVFPIKFDLEGGMTDALKKWDSVAEKLEKKIEGKEFKVNVSLAYNTRSLDNLQQRLQRIRLNPLTDKTRENIRDMVSELKKLAGALEKINKVQNLRVTGSIDAVRAQKRLTEQERERTAAAKTKKELERANTERLRGVRLQQLIESTERRKAAAVNRTTAAVRETSKEYSRQLSYVERLGQRMTILFSIHQVSNFLTKVREVTAQFELQQVALGSILQDQAKANALFSQIKQFAIKSPISIMDFTKYTKQVAAYRIEYNKLFDTTKRLADVSVGLGVDMGRLVLAFGQVRAASYLRAAEVRQFTEAGIPLLELLAEKFSMLNGTAVSTGDIMEMISDRMVTFKDVEQVFTDLTSVGGMFFNMQEKQGNTLFGMWEKLGDAASIMYDEIGNTEGVNAGMKTLIRTLADLMRNWQDTAKRATGLGAAFLAYRGAVKIVAFATKELVTVQNLSIAAQYKWAESVINGSRVTRGFNYVLATHNAILRRMSIETARNSYAIKLWNSAMRSLSFSTATAASMTVAFVRALDLVKTVLVRTGIGALVVALGYFIDKIFLAKSAVDKLHESLGEIGEETFNEQSRSVRNFEYLASTATDANKSIKERKEAYDELQRTYKDILPSESLEMSYLHSLKGDYSSLTDTIKQYIAVRQMQKSIDTIQENYGTQIVGMKQKVEEAFKDLNWGDASMARFWAQFQKSAEDAAKTGSKNMAEIIADGLYQTGENKELPTKLIGMLEEVAKLYIAQEEEINKVKLATEAENEAINSFATSYEKAVERIDKKPIRIKVEGGKKNVDVINDEDTFEYQQARINEQIKIITESMHTEFKKGGDDVLALWSHTLVNLVDVFNSAKPELISSLDFDAIIAAITTALNNPDLDNATRNFLNNLLNTARIAQQKYNELVPKDLTVRTTRSRLLQIWNAYREHVKNIQRYYMQEGDSLEDYRKKLDDSIKGLKNQLKSLKYIRAQLAINAALLGKEEYTKSAAKVEKQIKDIEKEIEMLNKMTSEMPVSKEKEKKKKKKEKSTKEQDPSLNLLKEEISLTKKLYEQYEKLRKVKDATSAKQELATTYAETIKMLQEKAKKYGFDFIMPYTPEELVANLQKFLERMQSLANRTYTTGSGKNKKTLHYFPNIEKDVQELVASMANINLDALTKAIDKKLKTLSDEISKSKAAKEFFDKVFAETQDYDIALNLTVDVFGEGGQDYAQKVAEQVEAAFKGGGDWGVDISGLIADAIDPKSFEVNYRKVRDAYESMKEELPEKQRQAIEEILKNGEAFSKQQLESWYKVLEKGQTFSQQYVELWRETENNISAIMNRTDLGDSEKKKLAEAYRAKQRNQLADMEMEAFKESPMYIQMFDDIEGASTQMLTRMRDKLLSLKKQWGESLSPSQLKDLQARLKEIDAQIASKNPFKSLKESLADYKTYLQDFTRQGAEKRYLQAQEAYNATPENSKEREDAAKLLKIEAERAKIIAEIQDGREKELKGVQANNAAVEKAVEKYEDMKYQLEGALKTQQWMEKLFGPNSSQAKSARENVDSLTEQVDLLKDVVDELEEEESGYTKLHKAVKSFLDKMDEYKQLFDETTEAVNKLMDTFGASEEDKQFFNDIVGGFNDIYDGAKKAGQAVADFSEGNYVEGAVHSFSALASVISGVTDIMYAGRVRKANIEIKKQQKLIEDLEYAYSRLEAQMNKVFGSDYIRNYNSRLKELEAQQNAYMKQAEAERSKGKKADKDKISEYEKAARDVADKIIDMQAEVSGKMAGTSVEDAAVDLARAWLDAKISLTNTFDAIRGKFQDMIKNMAVQNVLAKFVQSALQPIFDQIDEYAKNNNFSESAMIAVADNMLNSVGTLDAGLTTLLERLKIAGLDVKALGETAEATGIKRDIATASEESINGLAVGINTQNFYISQIYAYVQSIAEKMSVPADTEDDAARKDLIMQHLSYLPNIAQNTADTVERCERAAVACETMAQQLSRVIKPRGVNAEYVMNIN